MHHGFVHRPRRLAYLAALSLGLTLALSSCGWVPTLGPPKIVEEGQFKIGCGGPVRSAPDDPIVKFGQPGASHNHEFYGNRSVDGVQHVPLDGRTPRPVLPTTSPAAILATPPATGTRACS